ncbi:MAG TPA: hypothetical protein VGE52_20295, partial [Pirellulales bacterium]
IEPNFPPAIAAPDVRFTHAYYNMSSGEDARGPWNEGQGPWPAGEEWEYIDAPAEFVRQTVGQVDKPPVGHSRTQKEEKAKERALAKQRAAEVKSATPKTERGWSYYSTDDVDSGRAKPR